MGMYGEVAAISAAEYARFRENPNDYAPDAIDADRKVDLQKAWHGLHWLLSGTAGEGDSPEGFLLSAGDALSTEATGYRDRFFAPETSAKIASSLAAIDGETLWSRFDEAALTADGVYPEIWDEPVEDLRDEYLMYYAELRKVVLEAAARGDALVVSIA